MKKILLLVIIFVALGSAFFSQSSLLGRLENIDLFASNSGFLIGRDQGNEGADFEDQDLHSRVEDIDNRFLDLSAWERPEGPPRVGLQVGHWKNQELPDEFQRLRERGGGTSGGGKAEWEVNLAIAEKTASLLRGQGIVVDIIPATIPIAYWADVFIAIHADGNKDPSVSGFKVASSYGCFRFGSLATSALSHLGEWGRGHEPALGQWGSHLRGNCSKDTGALRLVELLEIAYQEATDFELDSNVSHNMRGYYAFNWRNYEHALHPMTTAVILETGFLTSPHDRTVLIGNPDKAAEGIVNAIGQFLDEQNLL